MNHVYRIVWNNAVRAWVAVAETARGRGKGGQRKRVRAARRPTLIQMMAAANALSAALLSGHANAQTAVAAPGQQTGVYVSPNGVTVVNIANPNAAGLSHNRYQQFNVGPQGLVLNNTTPSQISYSSQLAGQVMANHNMANQARVILNEVVANNRSQLAGFTEVLGRRADVVLANPYGITCSGCGFINTDRVTLGTGTPFLRADGSLGGFNVSQGDILVNGGGLNASAQQLLELVTRSVKLEANVNAPEIAITTGTNQWDYGTRAITGSVGATGSAPVYAIDSSALGGMYANRIQLTSTEAGVGVRMLGEAAASAEDFTLSAAGRVELRNRISAQRDVRVASSSSEVAAIALVNASLTAARDARIGASQGSLLLERGVVMAGANIDAAGTRIEAGQGSRLQAAQALSARATAGDLALGAAALRAGTDMQLSASGQMSTAAGEGQGVQSIGGAIRIDAGSGLVNEGVITADQGSLTVRAGQQLSNGGTLNAGQSIDIADAAGGASQSVDNRGSMIAGQAMTTQAAAVGNSGWMQAGSGNSIDATGLSNSGKIIAATGSANLRVDGLVDNTGSVRAGQDIAITGRNGASVQQLSNGGDLLAARALQIDAQALVNKGSGWIQAATGSRVTASTLENVGTWLTSQQAGAADRITVADLLLNTGDMQSAGNLAVATGSLDNRKAIAASAQLDIGASTSMANSGVLQAGGALALAAGSSLANSAGAVVAGASVSATAGQGLDNDGTIAADGAATLRADGGIDNSGTVQAGTSLDIADRSGGASAALSNSGKLLSGGSMAVNAAAVKNDANGWMQAMTSSSVNAASIDNAGTWLLSSQTGGPASQVNVTGLLRNSGVLQARQDAQLTAARIENQANALIRSGGNLRVQGSAAGLSNAGTMQAGDGTAGNGAVLRIDATGGALVNSGVLVGDQLAVAVGSVDNSGNIQGGASALSSIVASGSVNNQATGVMTLASTTGGSGTLSGKNIANAGTIQSVGGLDLAIGSEGLQSSGDILADGAVTLGAQGANTYAATIDGRLQSAGLLSIGGAGSTLQLNGSAMGDSVSVNLANVAVGAQATLASQRGLAVQSATLSIAAQGGATGRILAALASTGAAGDTDKGTITVTQSLANNGLIFSANDLEVNAPSITVGSTSALSALRDLRVNATAGQLDLSAATPSAGAGNIHVQDQGLLYAGRNLSARANGTLLNQGTIEAGSRIDLLANTLINNTEINSDGDIRIVAATLRNEVLGGDTRVFSSDQASAANVKEGGEYDDGGDGGNLNIAQNWRKTYTETLGFAPGTAPTVTPQITGAKEVELAFHTGKNLGGLIYGGDSVRLTGFSVDAGVSDPQAMDAYGVTDGVHGFSKGGSASFTNDSLATRTEVKTIRWTTHREEAGPAGGVENFGWTLCSRAGNWDSVCDYDGYQPPASNGVVSSQVPGLAAGVYTRSLNGEGFALYNQGGTNPAPVANARDGDSVARDAVGQKGKEAGPGQAVAKGGPAFAGAVPEAVPGIPAKAPTLNGISFLDANAANGVKGTSFGGIDITLPGNPNGLFVTIREPGAKYLVESNPLYMSGSSAVGSDYLAKLLGYNPDQLSLRLGDASYEAWLVKQQLIKQTGNAVLASYANAPTQMQGLMENAAKESSALGLQYGKALTPEQQAQLKQDIVWMVQTEIEGRTVLAPVVYLSQKTKSSIVGGAVISAQDANLSLTSLTNTGGTLIASKSLVVASTGDISNLSGLIKGGDVSLTSTEGSIVNKTLSEGSGGDKFYSTVIGRTAGIESTGSLSLDAKKDISNIGATMTAGTDASLKAGGNITFDTIENKTSNSTSGEYKADGGSGRTRTTSTTVEQVKSGLTVGGDLAMKAGNDITLAGTDAKVGGNAALDAGNNLNIVARENSTTTHTESKASGFGMNNSMYGSTTTTRDSTSIRNVGSSLAVGGDASFTARQDMTVQGSAVDVAGSGAINAANVNVLAGRNYDETNTTTKKTGVMQVSAGGKGSADSASAAGATSGRGRASAGAEASAGASGQGSAGLAFSSTTTTSTETTDLKHVGSQLSFGKDLAVNASKDVTLQGSKIDAGGNATVNAQNVLLLAAQDKSTSSTTTTTTKVGLMASTDSKAGAGANANAQAAGGKGTPSAGAQVGAQASATSENHIDLVQRSKTTTETLDITHQGSAIGSGGNLTVNAKDKLALEGSSMKSGGDMQLAATDMSFTAVNDVHEVRKSSDTTTAGLYVTASASATGKANADVALGAQAGASAEASAGVEVGLYGANTKSKSVEGSTTAITSALQSGGNITRTASNNISDQGTQISGGGSLIQSAKTIDSLAAANTTYGSSDSSTHTAKVGGYAQAGVAASAQASVGPGASQPTRKSGGTGAGVRASYAYGNETASSASSTAVVSTINMGGSVSSTSSGKTTMEGTQIAAAKDVSLAASSLDYKAAANTTREKSSKTDAGGSVSVDILNKEVSAGVDYSGSKSESSSSTAVVGGIAAGGNFSVKTSGDTRFEGTHIAAGGAASVDAGGNVAFAAAKNTAEAKSQDVGVEAGVTVGKKGGGGSAQVGYAQSKSTLNEDVAGSIVSGSGPLSIRSGGDATFTGTTIASQSDVSIAAGGNVAFDAARKVEESSSLSVGVAGGGGSDTKKVGRTLDAGTGKKTGGTKVQRNNGQASLDVASTHSESNTATGGSITSGGGAIHIASGGNTTLEGTQVKAAQGIAADVGGSFVQKDAVSTFKSTTVGVSAAGSGASQTPVKKPGGGTTTPTPTTPTTPTTGTPPATTPATPTTPPPPPPAGPPSTPPPPTPGSSKPPGTPPPATPTTGASKPPATPPPATPPSPPGTIVTKDDVLKLANGQGGAGVGTTSGTQGAHKNALTQQKGSGIVDVYVDKQNKTTTQSTKLDGGAGGIVIHQGKAGGQAQTIQASVPIASMPAGAKPQARTADGKALPAWLKFDAATGKFEGKPPADFKGELKVNVSVPQADGTTRTVPMSFMGKQ